MAPWCSGYRNCTTAFNKAWTLRLCAGSSPARGVSETRNGEDLWQWSRLEISRNAFPQSTIPQKQFIIIIIIASTKRNAQPLNYYPYFLSWKLHSRFQKLIHKQKFMENVFNYYDQCSSVDDQTEDWLFYYYHFNECHVLHHIIASTKRNAQPLKTSVNLWFSNVFRGDGTSD